MLKNRHIIRIPIEIKNDRNKNSYRIASKSKKNDVNSKNEVPESRFASYCKLLMSHFRKLIFFKKSTLMILSLIISNFL